MEPLYGFLIGVFYWPATLLAIGMIGLKLGKLRWIPGMTALAIIIGIGAWLAIIVAWGASAGLASLGGWLLGIALSAAMVAVLAKFFMRRRVLLLVAPMAMRMARRRRGRRDL